MHSIDDSSLRDMLRFYPGDEAWKEFAETWLKTVPESRLLPRLKGIDDAELSAVIRALLLDQADEWIKCSIPALSNRTVIDILQDEEFGPRPIRTVLMHFPV